MSKDVMQGMPLVGNIATLVGGGPDTPKMKLPPPPPPPPVTLMPDEGDVLKKKQRQREAAAMLSGGRASTILTGETQKLGG